MRASSKQSRVGRGRAARVAAGAGLILAVTAFTGCAKSNRIVDPGFTAPEGTWSADARMIVWFDAETEIKLYADLAPIGPSVEDTLVGSETMRLGQPGEIHGMILDHTKASEFEVLRRESGGGFRAFQDFTLRPTRRWLPEEWEVYRFDDPAPASFSPSTYLGRGRINGIVSEASPLTNAAELSAQSLPDIGITVTEERVVGVDTVAILDWDDVPGAAGYWVHVYAFRNASTSAKIVSGLPGPVYDGLSTDDLLLYVTGITRYKLGDTTRTDVEILFERPLLPQPDPAYITPLIRVTAVDAQGRMVGFSRGSNGEARISDTVYGIYKLGALQLTRLRRPRPTVP